MKANNITISQTFIVVFFLTFLRREYTASSNLYNYGGTKVACVCFYLSRAHEILCRGRKLLSRGHEIAKSWQQDTMSWP
jgi:hypothetical protein